MLKSTFPFISKDLTFDESYHVYKHKGVKFLNVTTWLSKMDTPFDAYEVSEKVSKMPDSEYYGMNPAEIRQLWKDTAMRGNKKHKSIERWLKEESANCDEMIFLHDLGINPKTSWSEIPLMSESLQLAGTADIITIKDNEYFFWDIKTCKKVDDAKLKKFSMQIMTYCVLLWEMTKGSISINPGGIILIEPKDDLSKGITSDFNPPVLLNIDHSVNDILINAIKKRRKYIKGQR